MLEPVQHSFCVQGLAKQLEWTPRQVERWWRRRRRQGKHSEMQRFRETTWRFIFYFLAFWLGLYALLDVSFNHISHLCDLLIVMLVMARSTHCWLPSRLSYNLCNIVIYKLPCFARRNLGFQRRLTAGLVTPNM